MKCTLLDVGACKSQMFLLTVYGYFLHFCFSSLCLTCFTGRMNCGETCFSLTVLAVSHLTFFNKYDNYSNTRICFICHSDGIMDPVTERLPVLSWQIFFVCGKGVGRPGRLCSFSSTDSTGHTAVILFLYHPFE